MASAIRHPDRQPVADGGFAYVLGDAELEALAYGLRYPCRRFLANEPILFERCHRLACFCRWQGIGLTPVAPFSTGLTSQAASDASLIFASGGHRFTERQQLA